VDPWLVMGRPVAVAGVIVVVLLALSAPLLGIKMGGINPNILPADDSIRIAQTAVAAEFPNASEGATLVLRGENGAPPPAAVAQIMAEAQRVEGVRLVVQVAEKNDIVLLRVLLSHPDFSSGSEDSVRSIVLMNALARQTSILP